LRGRHRALVKVIVDIVKVNMGTVKGLVFAIFLTVKVKRIYCQVYIRDRQDKTYRTTKAHIADSLNIIVHVEAQARRALRVRSSGKSVGTILTETVRTDRPSIFSNLVPVVFPEDPR
jgi:hypothetical protein